jgi:hypothetical protein
MTTPPPTSATSHLRAAVPQGGERDGTRYPARGIGILGGTAWESTAEYYRPAGEMVRDRLGGPNSP